MRIFSRPPIDYHAIEQKRIALEWFYYVTSEATQTQLQIECWVRHIETRAMNTHELQSALVPQQAPRSIRR
jgi:hypothetical protein